MIDSPKSAKNWYLAHSFNTDNTGEYNTSIGKSYVLASTISDDLYFEIKDRLGLFLYLGTNLRVDVEDSGSVYYLLYYAANYNNTTKQYQIAYNKYRIQNYEIDYEPYLNSKKYIPLTSLTVANLDLVNVNFLQGYNYTKQNFNNTGSFGTSINVETFDSQKTVLTYPTMQTYNGQFIYNYSNRNRYNSDNYWTNTIGNIPKETYKFNSRTPSTWAFGYKIKRDLEIM